MNDGLNEFNVNNTNITFSTATDNIATSDETSADPIYQRQMGTNYSKRKKISKGVTITIVALSFTAIAIAGGSILRNVFVSDPPTISNAAIIINEGELSYSFTVSNKRNYKTYYSLDINGENVLKEDCVESRDYNGTYSPINKGDKCKFYITFTNSLDYYKTIFTNEFVA